MVFYDFEYGYRLSTVDDTDTFIIPVFVGAGVEEKFNDFFNPYNLALDVGKKTYCDCSGEAYERDGAKYFRIETAKLYSK